MWYEVCSIWGGCVVCGVWGVECGMWLVYLVNGVWFVACDCGVWGVVCVVWGVWCVVYGVVCGSLKTLYLIAPPLSYCVIDFDRSSVIQLVVC